jgi:hypothetical protein
MTLAKIES